MILSSELLKDTEGPRVTASVQLGMQVLAAFPSQEDLAQHPKQENILFPQMFSGLHPCPCQACALQDQLFRLRSLWLDATSTLAGSQHSEQQPEAAVPVEGCMSNSTARTEGSRAEGQGGEC